MSENFKPITTQEEFNDAVKARLLREQESLANKYADYEKIKTRNTELEAEIGTLQTIAAASKTSTEDHEKIVSDLNTKIAGYETANLRTQIALQHGIPYEFADRLVGTDEGSLKADAERLAPVFSSKQQTPPPLKNTEPPLGEGKDGAYQSLIKGLDLEGE